MNQALARLDELPSRTVGALVGAGIVAALLGTVLAGGVIDAALLGVAALLGAGGGALAVRRHRLGALPLEISPHALVDADGVYRFRARLGRGRLMRDARATVLFQADGAPTVALDPVLARAEALVGAWTLLVTDPTGACGGPGAFVVRVEAREGAREWSAEARFPRAALAEGRFVPAARIDRGRLLLEVAAWDAVAAG